MTTFILLHDNMKQLLVAYQVLVSEKKDCLNIILPLSGKPKNKIIT